MGQRAWESIPEELGKKDGERVESFCNNLNAIAVEETNGIGRIGCFWSAAGLILKARKSMEVFK